MPKESEIKQIEYVLAWGSIAYVAGFITVMAHTARLGIPVIEILKPVYIWIGLPLAIVVFSIRWLWKLVKTRVTRIRGEFEAIRKETNEILVTRGIADKTIAELADAYITSYSVVLAALPLDFLFSPLIKVLQNRLRRNLERALVKSLRTIDESSRNKFIKQSYSSLRVTTLFIQGFNEVVSALNFFALLSLIPIACYVYVFGIYPQIPQSLGGGEPLPVILILKSESLPMQSAEVLALFPANVDSQSSSGLTTQKLEILYSTPDTYFVKSPNGQIFSLDKDLVEGIMWNPK